jgi:predicted Zn finger-like uncharacterized protein
MQTKCPECDHLMTVEEDFAGPGGTSVCSECGTYFDTEAHLQDETYSLKDQDSYVVDWQIG